MTWCNASDIPYRRARPFRTFLRQKRVNVFPLRAESYWPLVERLRPDSLYIPMSPDENGVLDSA